VFWLEARKKYRQTTTNKKGYSDVAFFVKKFVYLKN
jgi:hypothetical protein